MAAPSSVSIYLMTVMLICTNCYFHIVVQIGRVSWSYTPRITSSRAPETDNEFVQTPSHQAYFAQLEAQYRDGGVVVPLYARNFRYLPLFLSQRFPGHITTLVEGRALSTGQVRSISTVSSVIPLLSPRSLLTRSAGQLSAGYNLRLPQSYGLVACDHRLSFVSRIRQPGPAVLHT